MREPCVLRTIFDLRGDIVVSTGRLRTGEPALVGVYHHVGLPDSPNYTPISRGLTIGQRAVLGSLGMAGLNDRVALALTSTALRFSFASVESA